MQIKGNSGSITVQYLFSSVVIKMDRYNAYFKKKELIELKNFLSDCLREIKSKDKNKKMVSDWIKERIDSFGNPIQSPKMKVRIETQNRREGNIRPPADIRLPLVGEKKIHLGIEDISCFVRQIKDVLLEIRLEEKAKQK